MSKTYEITQQIYTELARLAESTGIKVEINFDKYHGHNLLSDIIECISSDLAYHLAIDNNFDYLCGAIQEPQIKQILIAFEDVLGFDVKYSDAHKKLRENYKGIFSWGFGKLSERERSSARKLARKDCTSGLLDWRIYEAGVIYENRNSIKDHSISVGSDGVKYNQPHKTTLPSKSEALCQRWCDGLNPLFETEPEKVLTELLEVLESIK